MTTGSNYQVFNLTTRQAQGSSQSSPVKCVKGEEVRPFPYTPCMPGGRYD